MINIKGTSLSAPELKADMFLFCRYTPNHRGDCLREGCKFTDGGYQTFAKRTTFKTNASIVFTPIPVYNPEFMGKREIMFRFGTIFITDDFRTEPDKDFRFLLNKRLYLKVYRNEEGLQTALMIRGNQRRK